MNITKRDCELHRIVINNAGDEMVLVHWDDGATYPIIAHELHYHGWTVDVHRYNTRGIVSFENDPTHPFQIARFFDPEIDIPKEEE